MQSTYFLIIHGSRDPRPQVALDQLARIFYDRLATLASANSSSSERPSLPLVGTGLLELGPTSLDEQIRQFSEDTVSTGLNQVQLLPLFLLPGVHVMEDIPAAVKTARQSLGEKVELELRPHLGVHQGLIRLLADQMAALPVEAWILLAHGSRRSGGNAPIEAIAQALTSQSARQPNCLKVTPAYWSVSPTLEMQVTELVAAGYKQIGILPYFLFSGSTTDAIAEEVKRLSCQFPQVRLKLTEPLNPNAELVNLILDLAQLS